MMHCNRNTKICLIFFSRFASSPGGSACVVTLGNIQTAVTKSFHFVENFVFFCATRCRLRDFTIEANPEFCAIVRIREDGMRVWYAVLVELRFGKAGEVGSSSNLCLRNASLSLCFGSPVAFPSFLVEVKTTFTAVFHMIAVGARIVNIADGRVRVLEGAMSSRAKFAWIGWLLHDPVISA